MYSKWEKERLSYERSVTADHGCRQRNIVGWLDSIEHNRWLSANMQALIEEAEGSIVPPVSQPGRRRQPDLSRSIDLAVTGRMAYIFSPGASWPASARAATPTMLSSR